ncbi:MAG: TolC family protein [Bacteriovoracia bacterium]
MPTMTRFRQFIVIISFFASLNVFSAEPLSLEKALSIAMESNPELQASKAKWEAESSQIRSQYWLENPKVGFMRENNMTLMQQQMGPMNSVSVSQEVKFPVKYFLMGSAQSNKSEAMREEFRAKQFEIRQKIISSYYNLYSTSQIVSLLKAQKETLREIARIAEARRATGKVPQQDEMKAHVEQTKLENELLLAEQEQEEAQGKLNALLNQDADLVLDLKESISAPSIKENLDQVSKEWLSNSPMVQKEIFTSQEADTKKTLARLSYAPDFMLSYRKAISNAPTGAYAFAVEATIPLWFFAKQTAETSQASSFATEAEKNLEKARRDSHAELRAISKKVKAQENILKIYETSLIPQSLTTLNSSRASYQAGRTGFLELLDSERSLYTVRVSYFQTLSQFVENIAKLEALLGKTVSSLPLGDLNENK